ncbi:hypothetical protein RhiirC2_790459 [Rhizophagus irregularis]|uniref:Uncharacterized protein n=1 Tax=Rhizophagus irregularis TaxID=588596 RepID=A0A2N1ML58_9GLOM|nr:hypothetical protein RhiirC2_797460 [Rhizophagus irregularis]PKK62381.1 hypothetical protein RhiirC2_790459 [Rhizophagus irregularis]
MYKRDVIKLDRQDDNAAYRVFCSKNLAQVLDGEKGLSSEFRGLFVYLFVMGELLDSYLNRNITHYERIEMAMTAYFFLHLWKYHIETLSDLYPSYISISKNFLAMQTFNIMISLVESLVLLIKIHRDYYKNIPLLPWKHGTESCEHIFGISRQFRSDFNYLEILQMVPKINQYLRSVQSDNLLFRKEKIVREGYDFNEYAEINLSNNNLECLRYWPSDIEIDNAISIGYERAIHLAKYLEMTAVPDAYYFNIHKRFPDLQLDDFWDDNPNPRIMDSNDELNVDNLSTNQCINHAISKMNINQEEEINSDDSQITFPMEKNYNCQVIVELVEKLPDIPWFPNDPKFNCNYILDDKLDVNIASNLVSYLTKNDDSTLTKSRENRWKSNKKTDNNTKDHPRADNSAFLPLQIRSFVIAKFDNTFCVAQIIAMYEQKSLMHSYTDTPVSDLKSLSYVSMKIFFHVNGAIFSEIRDHHFLIFSHIKASHIIHHLVLKDVIISEEALILKGQAKEYFNALLKSNNK